MGGHHGRSDTNTAVEQVLGIWQAPRCRITERVPILVDNRDSPALLRQVSDGLATGTPDTSGRSNVRDLRHKLPLLQPLKIASLVEAVADLFGTDILTRRHRVHSGSIRS